MATCSYCQRDTVKGDGVIPRYYPMAGGHRQRTWRTACAACSEVGKRISAEHPDTADHEIDRLIQREVRAS